MKDWWPNDLGAPVTDLTIWQFILILWFFVLLYSWIRRP